HRDAAAYREIIGSMLEETDRLGRLVEGLLTLSRVDGGNVSLKREAVDLAELARDVAGHLGVLAEEKRQSFAVEASGPVPAWVDRLVIRQALINLVDNAVKYTPPGGGVRIVVRDGAPGPTIEVADTGSGIPPEHRDRVFRRFIDPGAAFLFVEPEQVAEVQRREGATGFDAPGATYPHIDGVGRCSFEALVEEYRPDDAALRALAQIVRGADFADQVGLRPE